MDARDQLLDLLTDARPLVASFTKGDRDHAIVKSRRIRVLCDHPSGPYEDLLGLLQSYGSDLLAYVNSGKQKDALDQVDEMIRLIGDSQAEVEPKR